MLRSGLYIWRQGKLRVLCANGYIPKINGVYNKILDEPDRPISTTISAIGGPVLMMAANKAYQGYMSITSSTGIIKGHYYNYGGALNESDDSSHYYWGILTYFTI